MPLRALPLCLIPPPQGFSMYREKHRQRGSECWWALLGAREDWSSVEGVQVYGTEHLPPASPEGRLGNSLSSLTSCSVAIPHYILHQKRTTKTNLNY